MTDDSLNILAAVSATTISIVGLVIAAYVLFRTFADPVRISKLAKKVKVLENRTDKNYLNGREIERVLADLYARIDKTILLIKLIELGHDGAEQQAKRLREHKTLCDRHFLELELLSQDRSRRTAALIQISSGDGDWGSLDIIKKTKMFMIGDERTEFDKYEALLESRLRNITPFEARVWTGLK